MIEENKNYKIWLSNGYFYNGIVLAVNDTFVKIKDFSTGKIELLTLRNIDRAEEVSSNDG